MKFYLLVITAFLFCLLRSAGLFLVAGSALSMMMETDRSVFQRLARSIAFASLSLSGLFCWYMYVYRFHTEFNVRQFRFFESSFSNFAQVGSTVGKIFIFGGVGVQLAAFIFLSFVVSYLSIKKLLSWDARQLVITVICYLLPFLMLGKLDPYEMDRYFSVIVPFVMLTVVMIADGFFGASRHQAILCVVCCLWFVYPLSRTMKNVQLWHERSCSGSDKNNFNMN